MCTKRLKLFLYSLMVLSLGVLSSCRKQIPNNGNNPQTPPQLPCQIFTKIGGTLDELRAFEIAQPHRRPAVKIPEQVESDELWIAISYILTPSGDLAPCHTVAYSGRGNSVDRINLFMKSREVYTTMISPWLLYHYRPIGISKDGRTVYEDKQLSSPSAEDILIAVSLIDNDNDPKKSEYKLLWAFRKDIELQ